MNNIVAYADVFMRLQLKLNPLQRYSSHEWPLSIILYLRINFIETFVL